MAVLDIKGLRKTFGKEVAVADVSFEAARAECVALLGPSGCGKTSTLRMIAGLERPDSGEIVLAGSRITTLRPYERNIGIVFQDYALFPHMTVEKNIRYGMRYRNVDTAEANKRFIDTIGIVRMSGYEQRRPSQLSGGQQQRVALARALVTRPDILLLDEPLSNLDAKLRENLRHEIRQIIDASGVTTIIVTHDQQEALSLADRIVVMDRGSVKQIGTPREIYERPSDRFTADFIGKMNWLESRETNVPERNRECREAIDKILHEHSGMSVGIRPERMRLTHEDLTGGDWVTFDAVVEASEFLGPNLQVWFKFGQAMFSLIAPSDVHQSLPKKGDQLKAAFRRSDLIIVPERSQSQ